MIISYTDIGYHLGNVERFRYDENDTITVVEKPTIHVTHGDIFNDGAIFDGNSDVMFNIVISYACSTINNDIVEVTIPMFCFNKKPNSKLIKKRKISNRNIIDINNKRLSQISSSIYSNSMVFKSYDMENLVFMNKYIFGKPWYDILIECDVDLNMRINNGRHYV